MLPANKPLTTAAMPQWGIQEREKARHRSYIAKRYIKGIISTPQTPQSSHTRKALKLLT